MVLGGCGVCGRVMVVVVTVAVVQPVTAQIQDNIQGKFQIHASCGSNSTLRNLVVNNPMWLRTGGDDATLLATTQNKTCLLPPHTTHRVTAHPYIEIHVGGAKRDEEGKVEADGKEVVCFFPKQDLELKHGLLKVSCLKGRHEAETEMLGAQESHSSTTSPGTSTTTPAGDVTAPTSGDRLPAGRGLGLPTPDDARRHTPTTSRPQATHESLVAHPTPKSPADTGRVTSPLGTTEKTTMTVTEANTSTRHPSVTSDAVTMTTDEEVTDMSSGSSTPLGLVTEAEATTDTLNGGTTLTAPGGSGTPEAGETGTPAAVAGPRRESIKKENISAPEPVKLSDSQHHDGDNSGLLNDQVVYLAGAGAGVLALVLGVVTVASLAHHRRRQARAAMRQQDLFISGAYKGSVQSLTRKGSGGGGGSGSGGGGSGESGAYLNANVMFYSGAEPEMSESFEMEERILSSSGISNSSHDIPKCLK